jgi:hypothetical protein
VNTLSTETSAAASSAGSTFRRGLSKLSAFGKRSLFGGKGQSAAAKANRQWEIDQQERGLRSDVGDDGEISRPYDVSVSFVAYHRVTTRNILYSFNSKVTKTDMLSDNLSTTCT